MSELDPACTDAWAYVGLMPSKVLEKTEQTWRDLLAADADFLPARLECDPRLAPGSSSAEYLRGCEPFSQVKQRAARIAITGANAELDNLQDPENAALLPFEAIPWIKPLDGVMSWADKRAKVGLYICLSAHRKISLIAGGDYRILGDQKTLGIYEHDVLVPDHPLMRGVGSTITAPHARWCNLPSKVLTDSGLDVLAEGDAGWLIAVRERRTEDGERAFDVLLNGHPEYDARTLSQECHRDRARGLNVAIPPGYEDPDNPPDTIWESDRRTVIQNIRDLPDVA